MKKFWWVGILIFIVFAVSLSYMLIGNKSSKETQKRHAQLQSQSDLRVATFPEDVFGAWKDLIKRRRE